MDQFELAANVCELRCDFITEYPNVRTKGRPRGLLLGEALMLLGCQQRRDDVYSSLRINIGTVSFAS